ncbi:MAG TPA: FAD:protein FMN transferase [Telluria sp.]|nr:FAD:protein FMN transferase [Telluria sp.]
MELPMVAGAPVFRIAFVAMASDCEVMLAAPDAATARSLAWVAIDEVRRIEAAYSRYRSDSILSRINAAAGQVEVETDPETDSLLDYAGDLYHSSGGLFDITSGVLRKAWNFREARVPTRAELAPLLALTGWDKVERSPGRVRLALPGMELDFGGFGKEYAADRAAVLLRGAGVGHGYVNLGGDLRVIGPQPDGTPWLIAIRHPRELELTVASIEVHSGALASSGDYERYVMVDGRRYCHVLNPADGMSVDYWRSVSVLAPFAIAAGSYATITMLKGEAGLEFLEESGLGFLAIDHAGRMFSRAVSGANGAVLPATESMPLAERPPSQHTLGPISGNHHR